MEGEIERGRGVDIASLDEGGRAFMQTGEPNALERMHAITCQADAKCFHLGGHFEHIGQPLDRKFGDDRTAPRTNLDQFIHGQLAQRFAGGCAGRSEEHTSELQSLMRISYAVFCLKKKIKRNEYI